MVLPDGSPFGRHLAHEDQCWLLTKRAAERLDLGIVFLGLLFRICFFHCGQELARLFQAFFPVAIAQ